MKKRSKSKHLVLALFLAVFVGNYDAEARLSTTTGTQTARFVFLWTSLSSVAYLVSAQCNAPAGADTSCPADDLEDCYGPGQVENCECVVDGDCEPGMICQTLYYCEDTITASDTPCDSNCTSCVRAPEGGYWCMGKDADCADCPEGACKSEEVKLCEGEPTTCLSGQSTVDVIGKGVVGVEDVALGRDRILVSRDNDEDEEKKKKYQRVYSSGHWNLYAVGSFLRVETAGGTTDTDDALLEISEEHLLFKHDTTVLGGLPVRADNLRVGDHVVLVCTTDGNIGNKTTKTKVTRITPVQKQGLFSPLVRDGSFVVGNGVKVSSYTNNEARPQQQFLTIGNKKLISHHTLSHIAIAPFRFMCLTGYVSGVCHDRNAEGQLLFAAFGDYYISNFLMQGAFLQALTFAFFIGGFYPVHLLETFLLSDNDDGVNPIFFLSTVSLLLILAAHRIFSCFKRSNTKVFRTY